MTPRVGLHAWIPCEVFPGPFPDERLVRVETPGGACSGYVHPRMLQRDVTEGRTAVLATIVEVSDSVIAARLPGQTKLSGHLICPEAWISAFVAE